MKILIVDDQKQIVDFLKEFLSDKGHEIDVAHDGLTGLNLLKTQSYDLVFVDHEMPELTGIEMIKFSRESGNQAKMVVISGYPVMREFLVKAVGADAFLPKPFTLDEIEAVLKKFGGS